MSQLVSVFRSVLITTSLIFVGLASPVALADGTFGGNPPQLLVCGKLKPDAPRCGEATMAEVVWVLLTPAPPGGDGTDPRLLLCGQSREGETVACAQPTFVELIVELM